MGKIKSGMPDAKRQKLDDRPEPESPILIRSVADLRKLLTFHQDDVLQYRLSLQAFRKYLERHDSDGAAISLKNGILLEYLSVTTVNTAGDQIEALPDILQAWRYATQVYDEGLMVAIPGALAALLRTISTASEFSEIGEQICRTIIRKENLSILQKSLNSSRVRDASIARSLDLLDQVVSFDGGACARNVWLQRDITMQRLPQFLEMSKKTIYGPTESLSVRDHAIAFLLTNLRYQDQAAKVDILSTGKITQALLRDILIEKPHIIKKILSTLRNYVLQDDKLHKSGKGYLLTNVNLGYVLRIMRHDDQSTEWKEVHDLAESFLIESCTSHKHGIVFKQHGWYPKGTEDLTLKQDAHTFVANTFATEVERYKDQVPVRNTTLAQFILDLRPWASLPERRLILKIFEAAPELIADYLLRKKTFSFEPKLTATWIGWATSLYSILRLPCSSYDAYLDGRERVPPPMLVVIQSILPQSLTRQVLTKALKHQSELIKLFTLRILVASYEKMQAVLDIFQNQGNPDTWKAAGKHIQKELTQRWPEYKHIFHLYQSLPREKRILREVSCSLLVLYNTVTPELVSAEKMDTPLHITRMLSSVMSEIDTCGAPTLMELNHLIEFSKCTAEPKWWQKPKNTSATPGITILQALATSGLSQNASLKLLLRKILEESYLLQPSESIKSLEALLTSLGRIETSHQQQIFEYLDRCVQYFNLEAWRYWKDAEKLVPGGFNQPFTPLFMVLCEQWPFFLKDHENVLNTVCAKWQSMYLIKAVDAGESISILQTVCNRFQESSENKGIRQIFKDCQSELETIRTRESATDSTRDVPSNHLSQPSTNFENEIESTLSLLDTRLSVPEESIDHPSLTRWAKKDVSDAILDMDISNLIRYLASKYPEVRIQAMNALRAFLDKVDNSNHPDRHAIWRLIAEIHETFQGHKAEIPSFAFSLGARSILVVINPSHDMFTAVNQFLGRAPTWDLAKLPSYWMNRIFNKPIGQPNGESRKAIEWLLDTLIEGLQTQEDVNLYRRTGVFERVMANCASVCYEKMIHLLYRCCLVGGGSTLITRHAVLQFIDTQTANKHKALLAALKLKLNDELENEHVRRYLGKDGSFEEEVGELEEDHSSSEEDESVSEEDNEI